MFCGEETSHFAHYMATAKLFRRYIFSTGSAVAMYIVGIVKLFRWYAKQGTIHKTFPTQNFSIYGGGGGVYSKTLNFRGWFPNDHSQESFCGCSHCILRGIYRIAYSTKLRRKILVIDCKNVKTAKVLPYTVTLLSFKHLM